MVPDPQACARRDGSRGGPSQNPFLIVLGDSSMASAPGQRAGVSAGVRRRSKAPTQNRRGPGEGLPLSWPEARRLGRGHVGAGALSAPRPFPMGGARSARLPCIFLPSPCPPLPPIGRLPWALSCTAALNAYGAPRSTALSSALACVLCSPRGI